MYYIYAISWMLRLFLSELKHNWGHKVPLVSMFIYAFLDEVIWREGDRKEEAEEEGEGWYFGGPTMLQVFLTPRCTLCICAHTTKQLLLLPHFTSEKTGAEMSSNKWNNEISKRQKMDTKWVSPFWPNREGFRVTFSLEGVPRNLLQHSHKQGWGMASQWRWRSTKKRLNISPCWSTESVWEETPVANGKSKAACLPSLSAVSSSFIRLWCFAAS